jgi:hypothetical protein
MAATLAALLLTAVGCLAFTWHSARRTSRDLDRARRLLGETAEVAARAIREQAVTRPARACPRWWRRTPHRQPPAAAAAAAAPVPQQARYGRVLTLAAAGLVAGLALSAAPSVSPGRVDPHAAAAPAGPPVRVPQPPPDTSPGPQPPHAAWPDDQPPPPPAAVAASDRYSSDGGNGDSTDPEPATDPEPKPEPEPAEPEPDHGNEDAPPLLLCTELLGVTVCV